MLISMIRENKNNYYVNLEKKDNIYYYHVIRINNQSISYMSDQDISELFKRIFKSKLSFFKKEDEYDVYLDEANNQRFFKGEQEDFFKFFEKNGTPAILYISEQDNNNQDEMKNFVVKFRKNKIFISATYVLCIILYLSIQGITIEDCCNLVNYYVHKTILPYETTKITTEEIQQNIINSDDENLSIEQKNYLANTNFINDVIKISDISRSYILRKKTEGFNIAYFSDIYKLIDPKSLGHYNLAAINKLYLYDNSINVFYNCCPHEFIHLLQDHNQYSYILETSAEKMKEEYYHEQVIYYPDERKRLCVLMEMIGPQPIMECNFKGDTSTFEEAINNHLNEHDAEKLLDLFTKFPEKNTEQINEQIDILLAKMYKNITGNDINNDKFMNCIYSREDINRKYFNQHFSNFYQKTIIGKKTSSTLLDYEEVKKQGQISKYIYKRKEQISESEYKNFISTGSNFVYISFIPIDGYRKKSGYEIESKDKTKTYYLEDAIAKKLISKVRYYKYEEKFYDSLEDLCGENVTSFNGDISVLLKNGEIDNLIRNYTGKITIMKYNYKNMVTEDSIAQKFPDQVESEIFPSYNDTKSDELESMLKEENMNNEQTTNSNTK